MDADRMPTRCRAGGAGVAQKVVPIRKFHLNDFNVVPRTTRRTIRSLTQNFLIGKTFCATPAPPARHRAGIRSASMDADWMPTGWEVDPVKCSFCSTGRFGTRMPTPARAATTRKASHTPTRHRFPLRKMEVISQSDLDGGLPSHARLLDIAASGYDDDALGSLLPEFPGVRCANDACARNSFQEIEGRMVCACGTEAFQLCTVSSSGFRGFDVEKRASAATRNEELFGSVPFPVTTLTPHANLGDCDCCLLKATATITNLCSKASLLLAVFEHFPPFVHKRALLNDAVERAEHLVAKCSTLPGSQMQKAVYKHGKNGLTPTATATAAALHAAVWTGKWKLLGLRDAFPNSIPPSTFNHLKKAAAIFKKLATCARDRIDQRVDRLGRFANTGDVKALLDGPSAPEDAALGVVRPQQAMGVSNAVVAQSVSESFVASVSARDNSLAVAIVKAARTSDAAALTALVQRVKATDVDGVIQADGSKVPNACCKSPECQSAMCIGFCGFKGSGTKAASADGGETLKNLWKLELGLLPFVYRGLREAGWDEASAKALLEKRTKARYFGSPFYESRASRTVTAAFCLMQEMKPLLGASLDEQRSTMARRVSVCSAALVHGIYKQFIEPVVEAVTATVTDYQATLKHFKALFDDTHGSGEVDGILLARLLMHHQDCAGDSRECAGVKVPLSSFDPSGGTSARDFNAFVADTLAKASVSGKSGKFRSMGILRRKEHTLLDFDDVLCEIRDGKLGESGKPFDCLSNLNDAERWNARIDLRPCNARLDIASLNKIVSSFARRFQLADSATFSAFLGTFDDELVFAIFRRHPMTFIFADQDAADDARGTNGQPLCGRAEPDAASLHALPRATEQPQVLPLPPAPEALRLLAAGTFKQQCGRSKSPVRECDAIQAAMRFCTTPEVVRSTLGVLNYLLLKPTASLEILNESVAAHGARVEDAAALLRNLTIHMLKKTLPNQSTLLAQRYIIDFLCHVAWRWGVGRIYESNPTNEHGLASVVAQAYGITKRGPNDAIGSPKRRRF